MDEQRFDTITKVLGRATSRRTGILAAVVGLVTASGVQLEGEASRKATRRHEKLACRNANSECISNDECCSNRCVPKFGGTGFRCAKGRGHSKKHGNNKDHGSSGLLIPTGEPCTPADTCIDPDASCVPYDNATPAGTYCLLAANDTCGAGFECTTHTCASCICCDGGFDLINTLVHPSSADSEGIDLTPDNLQLLVADAELSRVDVWVRANTCTPEWTATTSFGTNGSGELNDPRGVSISTDGLVAYIGDRGNSRVVAFSRTAGATDWTYLTAVSTNGMPNTITGVAIAPDQLTLIAIENSVNFPGFEVFTRASTSASWMPTTAYGSAGSGSAEFNNPTGATFSADGLSIYIADTGNNRVSVWTRTSTTGIDFAPAFQYGTFGNSTGEMNNPSDVVLADSDLTMIVSNYTNGVVTTYTRPTATSSDFTFVSQFVASSPQGVAYGDATYYVSQGLDITVWGDFCGH